MDPDYRERAPRMIVDTDGRERLLSRAACSAARRGSASLGASAPGEGVVDDATMKYVEGRAGRLRSSRSDP